MLFNTWEFALFFLIVFALYSALEWRAQNRMLLVASCVFYGFWDWRFVFLMIGTASLDYFVGNRIVATEDRRAQKRWLVFSLTANLGVLAVFKYFNFFVENAEVFLGFFGLHAPSVTLRIILPIGVSFYTFQSMAYTIDIYRGILKPARSITSFLLFVSYFPHLVAGPINRPQGLLSQCERPRVMTWDGWRSGATLVLIGLFKKVVIADGVAPIADAVFKAPLSHGRVALMIGVYAFSLQIYADFSGYTDMARGLARIMGFELNENFHQPYLSASITEFWRRWHISLSTWLRDYLYIPLGGNRKGRGRVYLNLFVTMLLGGLWHGAAWRFVIWGGLHGTYLAVHKAILERTAGREPSTNPIVRVLKIVFTFHLVTFTWIFFRAATAADAFAILRGIVMGAPGITIPIIAETIFTLATLSLVTLLALDLPQYHRGRDVALLQWPVLGRAAVAALLVVWLVSTRVVRTEPFIYFQF